MTTKFRYETREMRMVEIKKGRGRQRGVVGEEGRKVKKQEGRETGC